MKEGKVILYVVDISLYGSFLENWDVFTLDRKSASSIILEYDDWEALFKNIWSKSESAKYMLWTVIKTEDEAKERMRKGIKYQEQEKYALCD